MTDPFSNLPRGHYGAILADPPWSFDVWSKDAGNGRSAESHYSTMSMRQIARLPVDELAAKDCVLFMWACWPSIADALKIIDAWGFTYKTCGFDWMKADNTQPNFFQDDLPAQLGMGYWTRANTEPCLLAVRGKPKRLNADVRMGIIAPRREHSRKPEGVHSRVERLVAGPYLELFARAPRTGWDVWGNQTDKFKEAAE
jgi:N6-adenosine-specific RNA methylase IME4